MPIRYFAICILVFASLSATAQERWVGTWGASPQPPQPADGPFPPPPDFSNRTVRQIVRLSAGGEQIRLRFSNEYGTSPLTIGAASVALARANGRLRARTMRSVTFGGQASTVVSPGAPVLSDPVEFDTDELELVAISLYFEGEVDACTCHTTGGQTARVSPPGNFTDSDFEAAETTQARAFLSGVDVLTDAAAGVVVTLGDSITDGFGSSVDGNSRWPDFLAERLARRRGPSFGVVNKGISGNRVLTHGVGENALARFDTDVLAVPGVTHVVVLEGINDIGVAYGSFGDDFPGIANIMRPGQEVTAQSLIEGYRQLIARAHSRGLLIYGATLTPYLGATYYARDGDQVRQAVNEWIRTSGEFDGVIDFDAALGDPQEPLRIAEGLHIGDFLHGSDAGYKAMAEAIDLSLFR